MNKWLVIQSNRKIGPYGPDDTEFLRECWSLKYAIEQNGDKADVWGLRHDNYESKPNFNNYDYIFCDEQYEFDWIPWEDIKESSAYSMHRWTDINCHKDYYRFVDNFDLILSPTKFKIPELQGIFSNKHFEWFPSALDERYFKPMNVPKIYDSLWLGASSRKYVKELQEEIGLHIDMQAGWSYIKMMASTKVFVNSRAAGIGDIPYKNFEAIGLGVCVVCDYDESYEELGFREGVNCYFFSTYNECKDKILYALKKENWDRVGKKSLELVPNNTYTSRIKNLKRVI